MRIVQRLAGLNWIAVVLSPLAVLGRGYSLGWDASGRLLRDASAVKPGDKVRMTLHRGELHCHVEQTRPNHRTKTGT